jgi:hypothetical protein
MEPRKPESVRAAPTAIAIVAVVVGIPVLYALVVYLIGMAASPHLPEGRCEGIGFGCSLPPREAAWLYGAWFGVIVVPVLWTAAAVVIWLARRRSPR